MKSITSKILTLSIFGLGAFSLLTPGLAMASNDGWGNLNWNRTQAQAKGMWQLENWLSDVQQRWNKSDKNHHHDNNNDHRQNVNVNYGGNNNVNVRQHQEVTGDFKSVTLEQKVRVYVNGVLTSNEQQTSVHSNGDKAEQWQEISVKGR
ncbi:MAG: hypothetical protein Q7S57_03745 [bacterium]|nr:hypothetical protein [bacterium]